MVRKEVCRCGRYNSYLPLWDSETNEWSVIFIHSECLLPEEPVYDGFIETCEECLSEFSSPFEDHCERCHESLPEQYPDEYPEWDRPYRSWTLSGRMRPEWDTRQPSPIVQKVDKNLLTANL